MQPAVRGIRQRASGAAFHESLESASQLPGTLAHSWSSGGSAGSGSALHSYVLVRIVAATTFDVSYAMVAPAIAVIAVTQNTPGAASYAVVLRRQENIRGRGLH